MFLKGTNILTTNGYIPIEYLKIGDNIITKGSIINGHEVILSSENLKSVIWIGSFKAPNLNKTTFPVCFKKGSLSFNEPHKDLWVSPGHRMIIRGKMIMAIDLVNGENIFQDTGMVDIEYYHLELPEHSVIIAENILVESYLEVDNRNSFTRQSS